MAPEPAAAHTRSLALPALLSAALFGITTPLAKLLLTEAEPLLVAGLLYAGSGVGLGLWVWLTKSGPLVTGLSRSDWPWLGAAVAAGGVVAPALLMYGLAGTAAATASLLLNLEVVLTAVIAWLAFREATERRVVVGFVFILAGSLLLTGPALQAGAHDDVHRLLAIGGACLFWAVDNNLTRRVSGGDARLIAAIKGLVAGGTNLVLALALGARWPAATHIGATLLLGFAGYGVSLVLFVYSLRQLGTARTGAYFATAPFIGGGLALALYATPVGPTFWSATACMLVGVWLHLSERHAHDHQHEALLHTHAHVHDAHHGHEHGPGWDGEEPHSHEHRHEAQRHSHAHFPDIHHRHRH